MTAGRLWKNDYFRTAIMIIVVISIVVGIWFGSQAVLGTSYPVLAVASGSMSLPKFAVDDGWSHPFERTLRTGDLIIVQGVRPEDIYAAPLNDSGRSGDILVFRALDSDELIVHRAVGKTVVNGQIFFITQGDNNGEPGPSSPTPAQNVIGKVIMRVPWVGHLALFMRESSAVYIIVAIIIVLIIVEFALPSSKIDKTGAEPVKNAENATET